MMSQSFEIPLFPLQTVLFPGQILPLNIFEERYIEMIQTVLAQTGQFGVLLIRQGNEVGETAQPFDVGTIAQIKQVDTLVDGRMNLLCLGGERFRVRSMDSSKPYLTAEAELWPWSVSTNFDSTSVVDNLRTALVDYLRILTELVGGKLATPDLPTDALHLANLAGFALRIPNREKQSLLEMPDVENFTENTLLILRREIHTLRSTASIPDVPDEPFQSYSPN